MCQASTSAACVVSSALSVRVSRMTKVFLRAGNSMLGVLDTYITAHGFEWPARVSAAANINDRHAARRVFTSSEAESLMSMVYDGGAADAYLELTQACASLMPDRKVTKEVCLLAAAVSDISVISVTIMQHMPRDKAIHVTSYEGTVCGVNVALSRPVCMSRSHIYEDYKTVLTKFEPAVQLATDQHAEVWMYLYDRVYEAVFPAQVMALVPCVNGEQSTDMQTLLLAPNGKHMCRPYTVVLPNAHMWTKLD